MGQRCVFAEAGGATWEAANWGSSGCSAKRHQQLSIVSWGYLYPQDLQDEGNVGKAGRKGTLVPDHSWFGI